ncbi:hypothetical protein AC579_7424 [Pseudocercospora musae]|uniref:Uncharacterized protein n=1 Tax=Pseudocercospora musae TaxID=113226 RepID=A0A139IQD9_9PEZI|nr:hypothetical protein AC579_7424 [Pseudocercospora musae]
MVTIASVTMPATSKIDRSRHFVRTLIDYGSGRLKIAVQFVRAGQSVHETEILNVEFEGSRTEMEQVMVMDDARGLVTGKIETQQWIEEYQCAEAAIFLWKLCLSPEYEDSALVARVYRAIGAEFGDITAIEELICDHLKVIRQQILHFLRTQATGYHCGVDSHTRGCKCHIPDNIQIESTITIPVAWNSAARGIMIDAATAAGFSNIRLQYEPLCAAASDLPKMRQQKVIKDDDLVCCADGGHGTMDLVTIHTRRCAHSANRFEIEVVGKPTGDLAGAQNVELQALHYIVRSCPEIRKYGDLSNACAMLGNLSVGDFLRQLYEQIAYLKEQDPIPARNTIVITGAAGSADVGCISELSISIDRERMISFIMQWAQLAYAVIAEHLRQPVNRNCHVVLLSGGISKCRLVIEYMKKKLMEDFAIEDVWCSKSTNPVARGGLIQYPQNEPDRLPTGSIFLVRDEEWDPAVHKQGTVWVQVWAHEQEGKIYAGNEQSKRSCPEAALDFAEWKDVAGTKFSGRKADANDIKALKHTGSDPLPDPTWVSRCEHDPSLFLATDRLMPIMSRSDNAMTASEPMPWIALIDASIPTRLGGLRFSMYYSKPGQAVAKHSPLRDSQGSIRKQLELFPPKYIKLPDLARQGFRVKQLRGTPHYECRCIVSTDIAEGSLKLRVKVLAPDQSYIYVGRSQDVDVHHDYRLAFPPLIKDIWGTYSSHVIDDEAIHEEEPPRKKQKRAPMATVESTAPRITRSHAKGTLPATPVENAPATDTNNDEEEDLYSSAPIPPFRRLAGIASAAVLTSSSGSEEASTPTTVNHSPHSSRTSISAQSRRLRRKSSGTDSLSSEELRASATAFALRVLEAD